MSELYVVLSGVDPALVFVMKLAVGILSQVSGLLLVIIGLLERPQVVVNVDGKQVHP